MANNDPFDNTIHKTNAWLADIQRRMDWDDRHRAWSALRAVLHTLRDRLPLEEAVALGAQLPMLVRGAYYEGWSIAGKPLKIRKREEFMEHVAQELRGYDDVDIEEMVNVVLDVLAEHISPGEADHLARLLPKEIAELWPS